MIKRILVVSACLVALIGVLVFPAGAVGVDYNDYITDVAVDGDNDIVTVSLPTDNTLFRLFDSNGNYITEHFGSFCELVMSPDLKFRLVVRPFDSVISLDDIPDGTQISMRFDFVPGGGSYETPEVTGTIQYYNAAGATDWQQVHKGRMPIEPGMTFGLQLDIPSGSNAFSPYVIFEDWTALSWDDSIYVSCSELVLTMKISSLYRLQQQSGKTNEILTEVEKQLADQGKTMDEVLGAQKDTNEKLDGIINDKVDSTPPSGGGAVGDLDDAEGQIRDDAQSGLDQGLDVQQSALQILSQYWSAFACVGWIFSKFTDLPFFSGLLYISFALGITGAILGLGLSISRSGSHSGYRRARSKGG